MRFAPETTEYGTATISANGDFSYQKSHDQPTGGVTPGCVDPIHDVADAAPELLHVAQEVARLCVVVDSRMGDLARAAIAKAVKS